MSGRDTRRGEEEALMCSEVLVLLAVLWSGLLGRSGYHANEDANTRRLTLPGIEVVPTGGGDTHTTTEVPNRAHEREKRYDL